MMALASSKLQMLCDQIVERYGYAPSLDLVAGSNDDANETKASVIQAGAGPLRYYRGEQVLRSDGGGPALRCGGRPGPGH